MSAAFPCNQKMFKRGLFITGLFAVCFLPLGILANKAHAVLDKTKDKIGVVYWHGNPAERKIALTFDDGPNEPYTSQILNILKSYNIKATFFLIGKNVDSYPEIARRIVREGHCIGNHTYSHPDLALELKFQIDEQIKACEDAIFNATGIRTNLFRPPYGLDNPWVFREAENLGYVIIKWSVTGGNGGAEITADKIVKRILDSVENGSIILLHDGNRLAKGADRSQLVKALPVIIESLQRRGYQFVTIPELLNLNSRIPDIPTAI